MTTSGVHLLVEQRLRDAGQRYTEGRRSLVEALAVAGRPLSMPELLEIEPMPQSSAYRHLTVLMASSIVRRISANDDTGYFELTDELVGEHHHHIVCTDCGKVADITTSPKLEAALVQAAQLAAAETGFAIDAHRIDLMGRCPDCQT